MSRGLPVERIYPLLNFKPKERARPSRGSFFAVAIALP
jgi:hypothetical protein